MGVIKKLEKFFGVHEEEDRLEPDEYIIETSSWPEVAGKSIVEGVTEAIHAGATVVEITADHPSSFAPHIMRKLESYMEQENLEINVHATMQLRTARAVRKDYERVQEYMEGYLEKADELDSDYLNVHTSAFPSPELARVTGESRGTTVSYDGRTAEEYILDTAKNSPEVFGHVVDIIEERQNLMDNYARQHLIEEMAQEMMSGEVDEEEKAKIYREARREYDKRMSEGDRELVDRAKNVLRDIFKKKDELDFSTGTRVIDELMMYRMVAWEMYVKNDSIWRKICGDDDPDKVYDENINDMVDAVAGKYIEGHVGELEDDIDESGVTVTLETPDAREDEYVGYYRLVDIENIYHVINSIGNSSVRLCVDFEHIASHGLNPKESMEDAPSDIGEMTDVVHLSGAPVPGHKHKPIERGDIDLYKLLWELRQKGFTEGFLNFERGGEGQDKGPYQESLPNLKEMAIMLEKDINPDDLPPEFYGYGDRKFKHDQAVIESHTFDPISGMLESPELRDTFLGSHAVRQKRKQPEEWKREEFQ